MPVARAGDPVRGVAIGWFHAPPERKTSASVSVGGLALVLGLLLVGGLLVTTGGGILEQGGRFVVGAVASPSPGPTAVQRPVTTPRPTAPVIGPPDEATPAASTQASSPFSCEDGQIVDATGSRWQLGTVLAGARRGFDRVTFQLARRGDARRGGRITLEWMSPQEARETFGLPSFSGRRGLLLTFPAQVTTPDAQLIGPTDLQGDRIDSISGVYRFIDEDGRARAYIAIRDRSCARVRAAELGDQGRASRRASVTVDLATP
jgi:hypothetical protein